MFNSTSFHFRPERTARLIFGAALFAAMAQPAQAVFVDPNNLIPTQLLSFDLTAGVFLPLTSAATTSTLAGAPAAVDGYGWVNSTVALSLSTTTPSTGTALLSVPFDLPPTDATDTAAAAASAQGCIEGGLSGNVANGDSVCVNSFFDVFFDVTLTDNDPTAGFFGAMGPPVLAVADLGPAFMQQNSVCFADTSQDNLGCLPPVGSAYFGHFKVVLPLGVDINGNGLLDTISFVLVQHAVGDVTDTFVQGGNIIDTFNSSAEAGGSVQDDGTDPPFGPFILAGPTTAQQGIVYPAAQAPEPATLVLFGAGLGLLGWKRRRIAS